MHNTVISLSRFTACSWPPPSWPTLPSLPPLLLDDFNSAYGTSSTWDIIFSTPCWGDDCFSTRLCRLIDTGPIIINHCHYSIFISPKKRKYDSIGTKLQSIINIVHWIKRTFRTPSCIVWKIIEVRVARVGALGSVDSGTVSHRKEDSFPSRNNFRWTWFVFIQKKTNSHKGRTSEYYCNTSDSGHSYYVL